MWETKLQGQKAPLFIRQPQEATLPPPCVRDWEKHTHTFSAPGSFSPHNKLPLAQLVCPSCTQKHALQAILSK